MFAIIYLGSKRYQVFAAYGPYADYATAQAHRDAIARDVQLSDAAPDDAVTIVSLETYTLGA